MKAILVMDMPKNCEECRLINRHYDNEYGWQTYCGANYHRITELNKKYFCPLKLIPERKYTWTRGNSDGEMWKEPSSYDQGWNDCIDEILEKFGEEE